MISGSVELFPVEVVFAGSDFKMVFYNSEIYLTVKSHSGVDPSFFATSPKDLDLWGTP